MISVLLFGFLWWSSPSRYRETGFYKFFNIVNCWHFWKCWQFWHIRQSWRLWETDYNWELYFMTIFVTWQLRMTLDSIRNSCFCFCHTNKVACLFSGLDFLKCSFKLITKVMKTNIKILHTSIKIQTYLQKRMPSPSYYLLTNTNTDIDIQIQIYRFTNTNINCR